MKCPLQHKKGKLCWCGGHNQTNAKKNKLHNSTKKKLSIKNTRRQLKKLVN